MESSVLNYSVHCKYFPRKRCTDSSANYTSYPVEAYSTAFYRNLPINCFLSDFLKSSPHIPEGPLHFESVEIFVISLLVFIIFIIFYILSFLTVYCRSMITFYQLFAENSCTPPLFRSVGILLLYNTFVTIFKSYKLCYIEFWTVYLTMYYKFGLPTNF